MQTEMFLHFFKSLSDAAKMTLNIKAEGQNEHHKIEGIFKALARALKMAIKRDIYHFELPSSKGVLCRLYTSKSLCHSLHQKVNLRKRLLFSINCLYLGSKTN